MGAPRGPYRVRHENPYHTRSSGCKLPECLAARRAADAAAKAASRRRQLEASW